MNTSKNKWKKYNWIRWNRCGFYLNWFDYKKYSFNRFIFKVW